MGKINRSKRICIFTGIVFLILICLVLPGLLPTQLLSKELVVHDKEIQMVYDKLYHEYVPEYVICFEDEKGNQYTYRTRSDFSFSMVNIDDICNATISHKRIFSLIFYSKIESWRPKDTNAAKTN